MGLVALQLLDVAIFGTMGSLWVFGAAFIYFVWRWAIRTEAERAHPVMRAEDVATPVAASPPQSHTAGASGPVGQDAAAGMPSVSTL